MKKLILLVLLCLIAYLLFSPIPEAPVAWTPPKAPGFNGVYAPNQALASAEVLGVDAGEGPETVTLDAQGRPHMGYADGRIERFSADGRSHETLVNTGGRPEGSAFDARSEEHTSELQSQ